MSQISWQLFKRRPYLRPQVVFLKTFNILDQQFAIVQQIKKDPGQ